MLGLISRLQAVLEGPRRKPVSSKDEAKQRLKVLLIHDQVDLTQGQLEAMKSEILDVIAKYVEIDREAMDIRLTKEDGQVALISTMPVRRVTQAGRAAAAS
jgi:cell division topological specificity factor